LSIPIGFAAGLAAAGLVRLIALITNIALFHVWSWDLPLLTDYHGGIWLFVAALAGGLIVSLLAKWSPVIRGHGIPEAMEAVLERQSRIQPRTAMAKPVSAAVAIGTGGPFGAEGPIIVTGGALGSLLGQVVPVSASERKILLCAGAAGGMVGIFGTPVAAVVMMVELLLFEFSIRALLPLMVSSGVAMAVHVWFFGAHTFMPNPGAADLSFRVVGVSLAAGLLFGILAVVISEGLFLVEAGYRRLPISPFWHPLIGGLGFALIGTFEPRVLGVGYATIDETLVGRLALATLIAVLVGKMIAWWVALGSGTSGGTLAPLLLMGGAAGAALGQILHHAFPGMGLTPGMLALLGMAAVFGGGTRAILTGVVFAIELTGDTAMVVPLLIATAAAMLVASAVNRESIMTEKLSRRGLLVQPHLEVDVLRTLPVSRVMSTPAATLGADSTIADAMSVFAADGHGAYPIVDSDGKLVGIVARSDLPTDPTDATAAVTDVARAEVLTVSSTDPVMVALQAMLDEEVSHVPVVESGRVVGMCTRTDVLRARRTQLDHETRQGGWRAARFR
jgi:H+/Cl- antiporter ClcA